MTRTNVAIACQGGGSHTAFTAGALQELAAATAEAEFDLVGLSGTSGGAICSLLSWYGMVHEDHEPETLLRDFWADLAASSPFDRGMNSAIQSVSRLRQAGVGLPEISPFYTPFAGWGQRHLRELLESHVDFADIPDLLEGTEPALLVSAIEVLTGEFELFREDDMSVEAILASAAEPSLFNAVEIDEKPYWDGLFAKNPPIQDFNVIDDIPDPDEIWIIKINPQERERMPRSLDGILDRRNELSGNLSLNAEVQFIRQVNRWIEAGYLPGRYTHTDVHRIRFRRKLD
jgi:NTE family protein